MSGLVWQEQVEPSGCGLACLAMLIGTTYARILEQAPMFCGAKCGVEYTHMDHFLAEHGYAVQRIERNMHFNGMRRVKWPPKPWADKHLALVVQTKNDIDAHYVVMDRRGNVYDPADPEYKKRRLTGYHRVEWVAAVLPVG